MKWVFFCWVLAVGFFNVAQLAFLTPKTPWATGLSAFMMGIMAGMELRKLLFGPPEAK